MAKLPPEFVKAPAAAGARAAAKGAGKNGKDRKSVDGTSSRSAASGSAAPEPPTRDKPSKAAPASKRRGPRRKKASLLDSPAAAAELARQIRLELSEDERSALETARDEIRRAGGSEVTLEQMIHRALAEWIAARRAIGRRVAEATARGGQPANRRGSRAQIDWVVARLRRLAADPLASWRELTGSLRRLAGLRTPAR